MYQKIMVPLDGSELAECVLPHVKSIAEGCQVKSVIFVRVVEPIEAIIRDTDFPLASPDLQQLHAAQKADAESYLQHLMDKLEYTGVNLRQAVIVGKAAPSLADYAENHDVDLIVMASHGRSGVSRWVFGSVADRVLRSAGIPVLIVRASGS